MIIKKVCCPKCNNFLIGTKYANKDSDLNVDTYSCYVCDMCFQYYKDSFDWLRFSIDETYYTIDTLDIWYYPEPFKIRSHKHNLQINSLEQAYIALQKFIDNLCFI